jgi:cellulose synthase (UDP-forming)
MLALDQYASDLALSAIVIGMALCIMPQLRPDNRWARPVLLAATAFLAWRYVAWRFTETIPQLAFEPGAIAAWSFFALEALTVASSTLAFLILSRSASRSAEADRFLHWWKPHPPPVDLYIATYNEELAVLERTIVGARQLEYPARIFVLDDGRRGWLENACRRLGVGYRTRPDNAHAKAGNINHTLLQRLEEADAPEFVAILDADFVPHRDFLTRAVALFHSPSVGLVQTPQHFFNSDPIQHNLGISSGYPDEQRFFFDHVEPARDAWGIAICCGTSSVVRSRALREIGGFPTDSITEDFLLTLRLSERGWRTVYLNEPLTEGLAPEGLREYIVQRARWCLGLMQIARNLYNPFGRHGLGLMQRLSVLDSLLYWTSTFAFRLASLACPLLFWFFGIAVVDASVPAVLHYYLPYYIAVLATLNWISRGLVLPILNDVSQLLAAWPVVRAALTGLASRGPHSFSVTAKGGDRTRVVVQWPLVRWFGAIFILTLLGLLIGLIDPARFSHDQIAGDGIVIVLSWTLYNLVLLLFAIVTCIERPRDAKLQHGAPESAALLVGDRRYAAWVSDLGIDQAKVRGPGVIVADGSAALEIDAVGVVPVTVLGEATDGYRLKLQPSVDQRQRLIRKLHTVARTPGSTRGDLVAMAKQLARALHLR